MPLTQEDRDRILVELHTILCDTNGNDGLCTQFKNHKEDDAQFRKSFYQFRLLVIVGAVVTISSGGIGAWQLASFLMRFIK